MGLVGKFESCIQVGKMPVLAPLLSFFEQFNGQINPLLVLVVVELFDEGYKEHQKPQQEEDPKTAICQGENEKSAQPQKSN
jgi:hypothetical protein